MQVVLTLKKHFVLTSASDFKIQRNHIDYWEQIREGHVYSNTL